MAGQDSKAHWLRERGILNPRPHDVSDPLFGEGGFFDPLDLVQVKYEMLRRVRVDGQTVAHASAAFGLSRPTFYQAQAGFQGQGLSGLVPKMRGPRQGHKLTAQIVTFIEEARSHEPSLRASELARRVEQHFAVRIHPRTIERRLSGREKKHRRSGRTKRSSP